MKRPNEYLKIRVLGAIDLAQGRTIRDRIRAISRMKFTDEDGYPRAFTWRTIETWRCRYNKYGVTALNNRPRSDKGRLRKVNLEQVQEAIEQVLPHFHSKAPSKTAVYRKCIEEGLLRRGDIAPNTFSRLVKEYDMLKSQSESGNKRRLAFAKAHANEMWQADTMFGPYVSHQGVMKQSKLIAFLDDASRVCCHGEFFVSETVDEMVTALKTAFYKRGIPQALYVDNGPIYTSKEIIQIAARIGCLLQHAPVRDGAAKGKIERFYRTVREQFLCRRLDLSSLRMLNHQFNCWVEEEYNARIHSVLGMSPLDRFALDANRIRYLPPTEVTDELFFVEEDRTVRADNTFSFKTQRYETPRHLANRKIQIRYQRTAPQARVIVFYKGERMGSARRLDPVANDKLPRTKHNLPNHK